MKWIAIILLFFMPFVAMGDGWRLPSNVATSIDQEVIASSANSTSTALNAGVTFTGTSESTLGVNAIQVSMKADQNATIYVEQSPNGTNWDIVDSTKYFAVMNNFGQTYQAIGSYYRVRVKNTSTSNMTYLRMQSVLCPIVEAVPRALNQSGEMKVDTQPYLQKIAEGDIPEHEGFVIFGYNPDIDNALESIWPVGGLYTFPSATGEQMEYLSTSANDSLLVGSVGAYTVTIEYLDANYLEQTEVDTMFGTGVKTTKATSITRVNKFYVSRVGSNGVAVGTISLRNLADTPIYAQIPAGYVDAQQAIYTVPSNKVAYVTSFILSGTSATANHYVEARLRATANKGVWTTGIFHQYDLVVASYQTSPAHLYSVPIKFPGKTDITLRAIADAGVSNYVTSATIEGWLEVP